MSSCPSKYKGGDSKGYVNNIGKFVSGKCHVVSSSQKVEVNSKKVKVIPGQGPSSYRQAWRSFYSKKFTPTEVESLLVRPLQQSIKYFQS